MTETDKKFPERSNDMITDPADLTDIYLKAIQNKAIKDEAKRHDVFIGKGLGLRISPTGKIAFRLIYRFDGKQRAVVVGTYPAQTLKALRAKYMKMKADVTLGIDPAAKGRAIREQAKDQRSITAKRKSQHTASNLVDLFLNHINDDLNLNSRGRPWSSSTRKGYANTLNKHFTPQFGDVSVADLSPLDISAWLKQLSIKTPSAGNQTHAALNVMFDWAADPDQGIVEINPVAGIKRKTKQKSKTRGLDYNETLETVIDTGEVLTFWNGMETFNPLHKLALQMLLLTGQRPNEVCSARWEYIVNDTWIIPASITKNRKVHKIPLTDTLREHLKLVKAISGNTPYLYPQSRYDSGTMVLHGDKGHITTGTLRTLVANRFPTIAEFTTHDLRRTVATHLKSLSANDFEIGQLLNHASGAGVTGIYARGSDTETVRKMLNKWHTRLNVILGGEESNVISLTFK